MKKIALMMLVLVLSVGLAFANGKTEQSAPVSVKADKNGGTLRVAQLQAVDSLCWYGPMGLQDNMNLSFCLEPLFYYNNSTGEILPYLAESYEMDEKNLTLTIKVKEGIKFHDGSELDAENVKWCIEYFRDNSSYGKQYLGTVDHVEVVDKYTAKFVLNSQNIALLFNLTNRAGTMYSKKAFETYGDEYIWVHPVGTGPFVFQEWVPDQVIKMTKNASYWNGDVYLDGVELYIYSDSQVAAGALEAGELDVIYGAGLTLNVASTLSEKGYDTQAFNKSAQLYVIGFNCDGSPADDPFNDIRVREAVCYAIDSETINAACNYGFADMTNQWSLPGSKYYNNDVKGFEYNPEKAKALLKEAGYEKGFTTRVTFKYQESLLELATIIQAQLKEVGINLELNRLETAAFVGKINDWDYGLVLHTATYEPAVTTKLKGMFAQSVLESKSLALGKGCFLHPDDLNAAIEGAVQSFDPATEQSYVREAQKLIHETYCLWYPLFSLADVSVYADYVKDWTYLDTGKAGEGSARVWLNK